MSYRDEDQAAHVADEVRSEHSARFIVLRDLLQDIGSMETHLAEVAEWIDNADCLRDCADSLQQLREHYWPIWLEQLAKERGGA